MSSRSNNPADWDPADRKTVGDLVDEHRETFESLADNDGPVGDIITEVIRRADRRD